MIVTYDWIWLLFTLWAVTIFVSTGNARACLKNHSSNLHTPIYGIFCLHSVAVARYAALMQAKSPANCDAHLAESIIQTRSRFHIFQFAPCKILYIFICMLYYICCRPSSIKEVKSHVRNSRHIFCFCYGECS